MSIFILGFRDQSRPARVEFILRPCLHKQLTHVWNFHPAQESCLHGICRHVSSRNDIIPVLRTGMKSARDEFIPGRNRVNDQIPKSIHPGTKTVMDSHPLPLKKNQGESSHLDFS